MYCETINKSRLERYLDKVRELDFLLEKKHRLEQKHGLKSVDLSKTRVTNGSSKPFSVQEQNAIELEKVNKEITELKAFVIPEHKELKTQLSRLKKWYWRRVIDFKYLQKMKTSEIVSYFFGDEEDYEIEKDLKYRKKVDRWIDEAITNLEKVSEKPFIKKERQLVIEELGQ